MSTGQDKDSLVHKRDNCRTVWYHLSRLLTWDQLGRIDDVTIPQFRTDVLSLQMLGRSVVR